MPATEYKDNAVISVIISLLEAFQQLYVMNKMKHFSYKSGCGICITKRLKGDQVPVAEKVFQQCNVRTTFERFYFYYQLAICCIHVYIATTESI